MSSSNPHSDPTKSPSKAKTEDPSSSSLLTGQPRLQGDAKTEDATPSEEMLSTPHTSHSASKKHSKRDKSALRSASDTHHSRGANKAAEFESSAAPTRKPSVSYGASSSAAGSGIGSVSHPLDRYRILRALTFKELDPLLELSATPSTADAQSHAGSADPQSGLFSTSTNISGDSPPLPRDKALRAEVVYTEAEAQMIAEIARLNAIVDHLATENDVLASKYADLATMSTVRHCDLKEKTKKVGKLRTKLARAAVASVCDVLLIRMKLRYKMKKVFHLTASDFVTYVATSSGMGSLNATLADILSDAHLWLTLQKYWREHTQPLPKTREQMSEYLVLLKADPSETTDLLKLYELCNSL